MKHNSRKPKAAASTKKSMWKTLHAVHAALRDLNSADYGKHTPAKRRFGRFSVLTGSVYTRRRVMVACFGLVLLVEVLQLVWPSDRFYPLATLDGYSVGGQSAHGAAQRLNARALQRTVTLTDSTTSTTVTLTAKQAGITVDYDARAKAAARHSLAQRVIPFSWLFVHNTTSDDLPDAFGASKGQTHADAVNASVKFVDGALQAVDPSVGYTFNSGDILKAAGSGFASSGAGDLATATIEMNIVQPTVSMDTAQQLLKTINAALGDGVTFTYDDGSWSLPASSVAKAVSATANDQDNTQLDVTIISSTLIRQLKSQGVALQVAQKAVDDGAVPSLFAVKGYASRAIDANDTASALASMLASGSNSPVGISITEVDNFELYEGLPTQGSTKDKLSQLFGDATYSVAVYDLSTGKSKLQINADEVTTSASTYKLFVAYSMIHAVESGDLTWDSPLNGMTLSSCMATMIVDSDNDCPEAWLSLYGFDALTEQAHEIGANNTNFRYGDMTTTANDLATVLKGYYSNSIVSADSANHLFELMGEQVYRDGIPTGIGSDGVVQDKVGFLDSLLNDAAIVRCDKGDYAMVIMTDGSSWHKIAQASLLIYEDL
ncbi:beta-lactamase [Bifidobacterium cebidarum]|uniref:Beta-lactamase n=2 Tax=Bifidobacterium cebidarum TaxID=2650773 RepID=A0A6I1GGY9_9BIFI|nr:beta-lactamase [Bifidobacterium cebidarum]